jgi:hypothetical protein
MVRWVRSWPFFTAGAPRRARPIFFSSPGVGRGDTRSSYEGDNVMLYAILCYNSENLVCAWTKEEDDVVMSRLGAVQERLAAQGRLGPVARLMPTTAATTLRKNQEPPLVLDGPFAETKEQLLGFYVVDCASLDEALDIARELGQANPTGAYEIRPISVFIPGSGVA